MPNADERIILITGATDGLGKQVAQDLSERGGTVLVHGRDPEKGEVVLAALREATGNGSLAYYNADFASLEAVRRLADAVAADHNRLDVLVNNAGIGFGAPGSGRSLSDDGHELRFQVNYLSGFLLTIRLLPLLRGAPGARVVNVASGAQQPIDFDDVMLERGYSGNRAYSQSKLAQIMFTIELAERMEGTDVTANALHPATYMDTNMVREAGITPISSVQTGADAVERLAISPELDGVSGRYFNGKRTSRADGQAYDSDARRRLWELSRRLTGVGAEVVP